MRKYLILLIAAVFPSLAFASEPPNLSTLKGELEGYHDSGRYYQDISKVVQHAMMYMKFRLNQNARATQPRKLAVVFDIDETTLSNYNDMQYMNFGGTLSQIELLESKGDDPAIPYTRTLYSYAQHHGISVFFVTGRREKLRDATVKNLEDDGFNNWQGLYMKPQDYHEASVVPYKTAMRKAIEKQGYDIIINIGDQNSDLSGGHADMAFKLPDPFYLIA